ncbi:AraC family transcriptional regulator [Paenibacillus sp. G2S3]|uniref:helix-turn-helix domain-containing protein n=1 Tax=Paenibacillus sp. G2S3 TaxID=3047872 RepID=UPI0024C1E194|nr:AraC family transcriptional regulator [Paenibacillus sp. G2S3]WHY21381.1 AraC family transcriptional regulator [Paenibacillus sp. G2S3]
MSAELEVFSDLSEELNYNLPDFPLYVRKGALNHFDKYAAACHWHPDLEFILVLDGEMEYFVNGEIVLIEQGNGIFVNSKRMHYGFSTKKLDCTFIVVVIHPSLLGENTHVGKVYWDEKFGSNTEDYIMITPQSTWGKEILHSLHRIYEEMNSTPCKPLRLLSLATSLCADVGDQIQRIPGQINDDQSWIAVWKMTGFIHHHFDLRVTLNDIATAGSVCRSKCCELFGTYIGQTPNTYLVRYRIQKSSEMLVGTNRSISEIAMNCGFQSASYFSSVFRNETGLTPQNYRKKSRTPSHSN